METSFLDTTQPDRIIAKDAWTAVNAALLEVKLHELLAEKTGRSAIRIDISAVDKFDTFGAWLLERLKRDLIAQGVKVQITGVNKANKSLFTQIAGVNLISPSCKTDVTQTYQTLVDLKSEFIRIGQNMLSFLVMFGATICAAGRLFKFPGQFRLTSSVHQFNRVAWQALPIVLLVTFIIGAIIAQQGFFHFRQFGAELYVVDMVGFLVMREIGVLLVAIVVAGRSGSSFTAELGSMKMREEIDALKTMGFNPIDVLVLPRVLVLVLALPVLTFIGSLTALFGAGLVSVFYGGITPELYIDRLKDIITVTHFNVGMIKAPFIGAVIGIIACTEGLSVKGSASSLGQHTTQSVVKSIFMVILLDGLFALFFSMIRM